MSLRNSYRVFNCLKSFGSLSSRLNPEKFFITKAPLKYVTTMPSSQVNSHNVFSLSCLNEENFKEIEKKVTFKALKIPTGSLQSLLKGGIKRRAYKRKKFNFVRTGEGNNVHYILLDPEEAEHFENWKECPLLTSNNVQKELVDYEVTLKYEDFDADEILRAILPAEVEVPTAFSRIGHIAHLNLRDEQIPYKNIIGEVMLDKIHGITTVVNKTNEICNQFRVFNMEVIAGENSFITTVREHHCQFELDFSKVYWNPRLSTEHERIVKKVSCGVLFDVFAGIGPFAIPAAKKGCQVYANDLNPDSFKWLQQNRKINKVKDKIECYMMDGRQFITNIVKEKMVNFASQEEDRPMRVHVVMNLPASAVEFLDAFRGLFTGTLPEGDENVPAMSVHCYCFTKKEGAEDDACQMVKHHLGCSNLHLDVHNVRNVAPNKEMMCVSFQMPKETLWEAKEEEHDGQKRGCDSPETSHTSKKPKLEDEVSHVS
ncbi:tRNA (guanine(37)-N1)-methyltransferase [Holothuria leucospilota]|uniref:tRNA (guanine(37)-N1)-methyltransferase n=1 Tax=Holothuria leucospilota TaxID=206669 RepID=A0A9Q1CFL9_HOLLE|nr:tRNA (guanine(37)-N1)-methyltransferase [Holothuria leucospilota]